MDIGYERKTARIGAKRETGHMQLRYWKGYRCRFNRRYGKKRPGYFQLQGQYGVAVFGGIETMELIATLDFIKRCTILS